jgi:hypothetical protein
VKGHDAGIFSGLFKQEQSKVVERTKTGGLYDEDLMKEWKKEKAGKVAKDKQNVELSRKN